MEQFLQATVNSLGLAAGYTFVALGFVIIYKSTQVVNFAQPALMVLGAYWVGYSTQTWGFPFVIAIAVAIVLSAITGIVVERTTLRPMVGKPPFAVAIITIGINTVLLVVAGDLLPFDPLPLGEPWSFQTLQVGGITIEHRHIVAIISAVVVVGGLDLFFKRSRFGLAMRAASFDQEVALVQGVSVGAVFSAAWAIGAGLAMLGGVFTVPPLGLDLATNYTALKALPVIVVGGLDSVAGAVVGALIVAFAEIFFGAYQADFTFLAWFGDGFSLVIPYVVMFVVLLVRPYGIFGTEEVERV
jgi:branched-chain amino acid transport system permease protein